MIWLRCRCGSRPWVTGCWLRPVASAIRPGGAMSAWAPCRRAGARPARVSSGPCWRQLPCCCWPRWWWLGVAPALTVLRGAEQQHRVLDAQLQAMQAMQAQARALQAQPRLAPDEARRQLEASVKPLAPGLQLSLAGDRATVTLKGVSADTLAQWLAQVRLTAPAAGRGRLRRSAPGVWGWHAGAQPGRALSWRRLARSPCLSLCRHTSPVRPGAGPWPAPWWGCCWRCCWGAGAVARQRRDPVDPGPGAVAAAARQRVAGLGPIRLGGRSRAARTSPCCLVAWDGACTCRIGCCKPTCWPIAACSNPGV